MKPNLVNWILGTANFGAKYGISNEDIELESESVERILIAASEMGIRFLDTAPKYGLAETLIGNSDVAQNSFLTFTKVDLTEVRGEALKSIESSLIRLNRKKVQTVFIHNVDALIRMDPGQASSQLSEILESGKTDDLGASVYEESEIDYISSNFPQIQVFQVPENILDQRLINSNLIKSLAESGIHFYVRSILLQGLITMDPENLPNHIKHASHSLRQLETLSQSQGVTVLSLALGYLKSIKWSTGYVIGTNSESQLREFFSTYKNCEIPRQLPDSLAKDLVDPRKWTNA